MSEITECYENGAILNGKRVVIRFKKHVKPKKFRLIHGSSADKASAVTFKGNDEYPVECILESSYNKV